MKTVIGKRARLTINGNTVGILRSPEEHRLLAFLKKLGLKMNHSMAITITNGDTIMVHDPV